MNINSTQLLLNGTSTLPWSPMTFTGTTASFGNQTRLASCDQLTENTGHIAFAFFLILVMVISVLGNCLVCIAIALSPNLRNNPTNYFVVSLAISDIAFAVFQAPIRISKKLNDNKFCFDAYTCWMLVLSDLILTPATIITLFVVAADRFYCIKRPFVYHAKMTKKRAKIIVAVVWFCACVVASLFIVRWDSPAKSPVILPHCMTNNKYFYMMLNFLVIGIPLVIMGMMYFMILRVAIAQIRAIRETEVFLPHRDENENSESKLSGAGSRRTHRELRATGTLAIVYGAFVLCWLPLCMLNIIFCIEEKIITDVIKANPELFSMIFDILPMLSSAINPVIYNFSNKQFRTAFKVAMYRMVGKGEILRKATVMRELLVHNGNSKKGPSALHATAVHTTAVHTTAVHTTEVQAGQGTLLLNKQQSNRVEENCF